MKTILVVDDEAVIRSLAELSLKNADWQVHLAPDAWSALKEIESSKPDLIFLDLGLPGMSGQELARRLRSDDSTASIPIVYLTGVRPSDTGEADGVVQKPFTPETLRALARSWL